MILKKGSRNAIAVSSVRDPAEFLKALRELKRAAVDPFLKPLEELRDSLVRPVVEPLEGELKRALGSALYNSLMDLGGAKELSGGSLEELRERIKRHFGA